MPSARAQSITSPSHCPSNTGHHPRYPLSTRVPMDIDTQPGVQTSMGSKTQMDGVKLGSHSTSGQRATGAADAAPGCVGGSSFSPYHACPSFAYLTVSELSPTLPPCCSLNVTSSKKRQTGLAEMVQPLLYSLSASLIISWETLTSICNIFILCIYG